MFDNNSFNFGLPRTAKIIRIEDDEVIREIEIDIEQNLNENANFVGSGIASGGRNMIVYTFDSMEDVEPYLYQLEINETKFVLTSKQKGSLQKSRRYSLKKARYQMILTLE